MSHYIILCLICGCLSSRAAVEKLHCVDDAFRRQLEAVQAAHQAELLRQANEKQKQIEQANQRVKYRHFFHRKCLVFIQVVDRTASLCLCVHICINI